MSHRRSRWAARLAVVAQATFALSALVGCSDQTPALATDTPFDADTHDGIGDTTGDLSDTRDVDDESPADAGTDPSADVHDTETPSLDTNRGTDDDASERADVSADTSADDTLDAGTDPSCGPPTAYEELGELSESAGWRRTVLPRCTRVAVPFVAPLGSRWRVDATALPSDTSLLVWTPHYRSIAAGGVGPDPLARAEAAGVTGVASVEVTPRHGGELLIVLERDDRTRDAEVDLRLTCLEGCDRRTTRYPLVLVHGYAGVDSYFGVLDYFYDVVPTLTEAGYSAFTPVTDPIERSEIRADQLRDQVDEILRDTGAERVHLIGHSQGGLDARVLISRDGYGDRVASLTTIAAPHRGIPLRLADFVSRQDFSPEYMETFNRAHSDDDRVRYFSWSFRSCRALQFTCRRESEDETVDAFLIASHALLSRFGDNDGVVPTDSMRWGEHLGLRFADHFDEVGQIADRDGRDDAFPHRAFYRSEAERLADMDGTPRP